VEHRRGNGLALPCGRGGPNLAAHTLARQCYHTVVADSAWVPDLASTVPSTTTAPRHSAAVRATHWITTLCFFALLVSGVEIVISHPRFYWGEAGNVLTPPLFVLPIPASRASVPTGYGFVLPDQNGWSRSLHFQSAWALVFTGLLYTISGLLTRHIRANLLPAATDLTWGAFSRTIADHLRFQPPSEAESRSYNVLQRLTYLCVIFALFPLMIWTGLAMSPAIASAFPAAVMVFGGQQSARTIHFFGTLLLVVFLLVHIAMVWRAGFRNRVRAMIAGRASAQQERP
jgi:thiosulfate reductase cytochrome b subunit